MWNKLTEWCYQCEGESSEGLACFAFAWQPKCAWCERSFGMATRNDNEEKTGRVNYVYLKIKYSNWGILVTQTKMARSQNKSNRNQVTATKHHRKRRKSNDYLIHLIDHFHHEDFSSINKFQSTQSWVSSGSFFPSIVYLWQKNRSS